MGACKTLDGAYNTPLPATFKSPRDRHLGTAVPPLLFRLLFSPEQAPARRLSRSATTSRRSHGSGGFPAAEKERDGRSPRDTGVARCDFRGMLDK